MKKSGVFVYFSIIIILLLTSINTTFADNKTGTFEENFQGTHYYGYIPEDCAKSKNMSLVVALHGAGGSAKNFITAWTQVAKDNKFAVLAVKSVGQTWTFNSGELVDAAIEDFKKHCDFDKNRILINGFSAGAHVGLHMAVKYNKYAAVAPVGGGCVIEYLSSAEIQAASSLPVYFIAGEKDPNLAPIKQVKKKLEDYGYTVKLDVAAGLGHNYPNDASENIWKWFDNIGPMHIIEKLKTQAESAYKEKKLAESYDLYCKLLAKCSSIPAKYLKENKKLLEDYMKLAKEKLKKLEELWTKKEPKAFALIEKCYKYLDKMKLADAAKNFAKIIDEFKDSEAAKLAKIKLEEILSANMEIADKLAGTKPKSALKKAEKTLNKSKLSNEERLDALKVLQEIIDEYPHTSYAKTAKELIDRYD